MHVYGCACVCMYLHVYMYMHVYGCACVSLDSFEPFTRTAIYIQGLEAVEGWMHSGSHPGLCDPHPHPVTLTLTLACVCERQVFNGLTDQVCAL